MKILQLIFKYFKKIGEYIEREPGAPFILVFVGLLVTATLFLCMNNDTFAEKLAEYAYYSLVAGILLQCIAVVIKNGEKTSSSSNLLFWG